METVKKYDELTASYNTVRSINMNKTFSAGELVNKVPFLPFNKNYIHVMVKHGLVIKIEKGTYSFPEKPVYWNKLKDAIEELHEIQRSYQRKYAQKKKKELHKEVEDSPNIEEILTTYDISYDSLAKFLVSTGNYRIQRKKVSYEEI